MERWFIVGFMVAMVMVLAVMGWHFRPTDQGDMQICAVADAHCGHL